MITCLPRAILSLICFPLLGAYGLRWVGHDVLAAADSLRLQPGRLVSLLDYLGAGVGLLVGLVWGLQMVACGCQRRNKPLQATADVLLLGLVALFLLDALLPPLLAGTGIAAFLPPLTLVVWLATGAATSRLCGLRRRDSRRRPPAEDPEARPEPAADYR